MVQYNGITLFRGEDGLPLQVNIDLRVHGAELDTFMRAHGLSSVETSEIARSVTGKELSSTYAVNGKPQGHVHYLPNVKRTMQTALDDLFADRKARPENLTKEEFKDLLIHRIDRALTPIPRTKAATPKIFERHCGKDTFWVRFKMQNMQNVTWCVFYTVHDNGIVLVRHIMASTGEGEEL